MFYQGLTHQGVWDKLSKDGGIQHFCCQWEKCLYGVESLNECPYRPATPPQCRRIERGRRSGCSAIPQYPSVRVLNNVPILNEASSATAVVGSGSRSHVSLSSSLSEFLKRQYAPLTSKGAGCRSLFAGLAS